MILLKYKRAILHMSNYEKKQLEKEFKKFTSRHFESPSSCKNLGQIQFYVNELTLKITEYRNRFNHVPEHAYVLLHDYNMSQNRLIFRNFQKDYSF